MDWFYFIEGEEAMAAKKQYAIRTRFVFEGYFFINAENKVRAKEYAEKHCGLALRRGIHSSLPNDAVDWDFPCHPEKRIGEIKLTQKAADDYRQCALAKN
jgi:hypothetical protein